MEAIYIILLLVIIYLLVTNKNDYNQKIEHLEVRILELQRILRQGPRPTVENEKPAVKPVEEVKLPPVPPPVITEPKVEWNKEVISDSSSIINRPVKNLKPTASVPATPARA